MSKSNVNEDLMMKSSNQESFISVLITTFATVFIAEIGDKTQLATLLLSAESGRPLIVFIGAGVALICSSFVGVLLGRWLSLNMPEDILEYSAGFLMIGIAFYLGIQAINPYLSALS